MERGWTDGVSTVVSPGVVPDGEGSPVSGMRAGVALISSCSL